MNEASTPIQFSILPSGHQNQINMPNIEWRADRLPKLSNMISRSEFATWSATVCQHGQREPPPTPHKETA